MARSIPDSRVGRALMAGIPVALILFAAELLDGSFRLDQTDHGLSLSWSPSAQDEARRAPTIRVASGDMTLSFSVKAPRIASDMASFAGRIANVIWSDCPEQRARLATA